ncbi:MAG: PAS domain S-box protein [bacterium]|nr:PAS domain S-box protein [bacterium]
MFKHSDLTSAISILQNPRPESFFNFLQNTCRNLNFDSAVIYWETGTPEELHYFAGIYKGKPLKELPVRFPVLDLRHLGKYLFKDSQNKILEIEREQIPDEQCKQFLQTHNIKKIFLAPILTPNLNYSLLIFGSESKRSLEPEEIESLRTYVSMFAILLDIYQTKWVYNVVKNNIREHIIIQDLNHRILEANRAASLSLGIENPSELKGKLCYQLWHQRNTPCPFCPLEKTRATLKPEENEVRTPDGRWYFIRSNPIFNEAGELTGFVELTLEITEKKKAEQEAERFQKIVKNLFDQTLVGVVISDYDGNILEANDKRARMLGYEKEELLKMKWTDYTHPDDVGKLLEKLRALKVGQIKNFTEDVRCIKKDGKTIWQRLFVTPLKIDDESLLITTVMDITDDISLREELQKLLAERTLILNTIPQKIYKVTKNGDAIPITSTSEKGIKLGNLIGKTPEEAKELIQTVLSKGEPSKIIHLRKQETGKKYLSTTFLKLDNDTILSVENDVTEIKMQQIEALKQRNRLITLTEGIIKTLSYIVELKEPYTAGHQSRVAEIAYIVGKEMGLEEERLRAIRYAGLLHDIGKIIIPIEVLNKPSKLTESEFNLIKQHPTFSYEILKNIEFEGPVAEIAFQHHERINGSGYPRGLKDDEILLEARIIACADVYEAMTSHRPYRPALSPEEALKELKEKAGILYDPEVVRIMEKLYLEGKLPKSSS